VIEGLQPCPQMNPLWSVLNVGLRIGFPPYTLAGPCAENAARPFLARLCRRAKRHLESQTIRATKPRVDEPQIRAKQEAPDQ